MILLRNMAKLPPSLPRETALKIAQMYSYQGKDDSVITNYVYTDKTLYLPPNKQKLRQVAAILGEEIIDQRSAGAPISTQFKVRDDFKFRPHQEQPASEFLNHIKEHQYGVLEAPCGSGKTVMLSYTAGQLQCKTLIVVDIDIFGQWEFAFDVVYGVPVQKLTKDTTKFADVGFTTFQFLNKNKEILSRIKEEYGCLIVDEMHSIGSAETYKGVMYRLNNKYRCGTTATFMNKNFPKEILIDTISSVSVKMNETDTLVPDVYFVKTGIEWISNDPYEIAKVNKNLTNNQFRNSIIQNLIETEIESGGVVILIANSTEQAKMFGKVFKAHKTVKPVVFVSGTSVSNDELKRRVSSGECNLILTCRKVEKAVDLPSADCMIMARLFNSEAVVQQLRGRIERNVEGKRKPVLYVLVDTLEDRIDDVWSKTFQQKSLAEVFAWKHKNWHQKRGCSLFELNSNLEAKYVTTTNNQN